MKNEFDFKGKRAVVTGGSRGIGLAVAVSLLELGAEVAVTSTGEPPGWLAEYKKAVHFRLDYSSERVTEEFFNSVDSFGEVNVVINNAGIHMPQAISELDNEAWELIFKVNVQGAMQCIRHFGGKMCHKNGGKIVNIASIAATICKKNSTAYASSKSALLSLTRSAALEFAPYSVLVNAVSPGTTLTDMVDRHLTEQQKDFIVDSVPLKRFAKPQEIANVVLFLASDLNSYVTGQNFIVDGGTVISQA